MQQKENDSVENNIVENVFRSYKIRKSTFDVLKVSHNFDLISKLK